MPILMGSTLANVGQALMIGALGAVVVAFWAALAALRRKDNRLLSIAFKASLAFSVFIFLAYVDLIYAFFTHDFSISYVARYSERAMPNFYLFCAGWGGQDGSLLFWTLLMGVMSVIALHRIRKNYEELFPAFLCVVSAVQLFFAITTFFAADPFATLAVVPADGKGLNPLLQTPVMAIHPPNLYMGLIAFYIPYALGMAAMISGHLDNRWIRATRSWSLLAWSFLTVGNVLGGYWAYNELGWGGFWAWDPVENASFLPWLMATAFLHTAIVQERRNMMKIWNMSLLILTFFLTIFGTFLTRSGLISSVHAFAKSDIGEYFVVFLVLILVVSFGLVFYRRKELQSKNQLASPISREASFLFNNALFSIATFVVLLGTTYPLLMEKLTGTKATVGPPFFNRVMSPIALGFLVLLGVCPLLGWYKPNKDRLKRLIVIPALLGAVGAAAFGTYFIYWGPGHPDRLTQGILISIGGLCIFILSAMFMDLLDEGKRRLAREEAPTLIKSMLRHITMLRRQYGGYLVHIGVVFAFIGFAGYGFNLEKGAALKKGELTEIGGYLVKFTGLQAWQDRQKKMVEGHLEVYTSKVLSEQVLRENQTIQLPHNQGTLTLKKTSSHLDANRAATIIWQRAGRKAQHLPPEQSVSLKNQLIRFPTLSWNASKQLVAVMQTVVPGKRISKLVPARHKYTKHPELTTEVALDTQWKNDFYAILVTWETQPGQEPLAHFKFYINPLLFWLWLGTVVMLLGAAVAAIPQGKRHKKKKSKESEGSI